MPGNGYHKTTLFAVARCSRMKKAKQTRSLRTLTTVQPCSLRQRPLFSKIRPRSVAASHSDALDDLLSCLAQDRRIAIRRTRTR